jgi:tetratricopeptide (TPR) repeat protein
LWGALALDRGDFGTAIRELQSALKLNPTFPKAEYELGLALYSKGDPQSAIPHLQQAAKLDSPEAAQFLKKITK